MSGIAVRLGYGFGKDPFGCNAALMPKPKVVEGKKFSIHKKTI